MKLLKNLFGTKKNPMLTKLEEISEVNLKEVYYSFGFVYSNENYRKFKIHLEQNSLPVAKSELKFDVSQDNIEVYFAEDFDGEKFIIMLMDYFEPLQRGEILEKIPLASYPRLEMEKLK